MAGIRKTHIHRIYKDDNPDSGIWVDIERIDELTYSSGAGFAQQEKVWTFNWADFNPDGDGVTKKKIKDPNDTSSSGNGSSDDSGSADSSASVVLVPVRDKIEIIEGDQEYAHLFGNDSGNTSRKTHSRRVYHYDVPDDQLDENKNPPRNPDDYLNALGAKDASQYLEVEILDSFTTNENESRDSHGRIKPSVNQDKIWLVNNDSALLSDRDGDTSNDFATKNPADGKVDPPWRLDPLQNIVNVGFGDPYKLVMFRQGEHGDPQCVIAFTTPKAFFTSSEVNAGAKNENRKLPSPSFGGNIPATTNTHSPNKAFSNPPPPGPLNVLDSSVSGNSLNVAEPFGSTDYRGYTTFEELDFKEQPDGQFFAFPIGNKFYFNYKGESISSIPPMSKIAATKGLSLASDGDGTVYVRSGAFIEDGPSTPLEGITKYGRDGSVIWNSNPTQDAAFAVRCANYDPKKQLITFVIIGQSRGNSNGTIKVWDLDGNEVSSIDLPDGYRLFDVSKKGKLYAFNLNGGGMAAFSSTGDAAGDKLWETSPGGSFGIDSITAFGEDWVVTVETGNGGGSSDLSVEDGPGPLNVTTTVTSSGFFSVQMGVYNANTGTAANSDFWATAQSSETRIFDADFNFDNLELNIDSYASLLFVRSAYFP